MPNHVNIVCRLIYLFILLSYIWKIGSCVIFPTTKECLWPKNSSVEAAHLEDVGAATKKEVDLKSGEAEQLECSGKWS